MSTAQQAPEPSLQGLASRWLATKQLARRSPLSDVARRADLADAGAFELELARLSVDDLDADGLREAFATYAIDHAPSSLRRVLSTWRGFCRWLRREGHLVDDRTEHLEGPRRPDWKPKPLELVELERVIEAASTTDPGGRVERPGRAPLRWPDESHEERISAHVATHAGLTGVEVAADDRADLGGGSPRASWTPCPVRGGGVSDPSSTAPTVIEITSPERRPAPARAASSATSLKMRTTEAGQSGRRRRTGRQLRRSVVLFSRSARGTRRPRIQTLVRRGRVDRRGSALISAEAQAALPARASPRQRRRPARLMLTPP